MRVLGLVYAKTILALALAAGCASDKIDAPKKNAKKDPAESVGPGVETAQNDGATLGTLDWKQVSFQFVSPKDVEDLARGHVQFEIDTNLSDKGTWSLYYTTSFKSLEGALPIKEDLNATEKTVVWDTMQVEPSTYFVFATLTYGSQVNVRFFQGAITVEEEGSDNRTPFVTITTSFFNNRNRPIVMTNGQEMQISYVAVEPDGDAMDLDLEISADDGTTWTSLGIDLGPNSEVVTVDPEDPTRYTLNYTAGASLPIGTNYRLRLIAVDEVGKVGVGITSNFGIVDSPISYAGGTRPVRQIFSDSCGTCHFGGTVQGNLRLDYYDKPFSGQQGVRNRRDRIDNRIHRKAGDAGFMPQTGSLPADDLARLTMFYWDDFRNAGDQPDIRAQNYTSTTELMIGTATSLSFVVNDDDVGDRAETVVQMAINPAGDEQGFRAIDLASVTRTDVAGGVRYEISYTPPADMALGTATIRVRADDGRGRLDEDSRTVEVVAAPPAEPAP